MGGVIIDKMLLGWAKRNNTRLRKKYSSIHRVLDNPEEGDLKDTMSDKEISTYAQENNCDILTSDKKFYIFCFEAGITNIQIRKYAVTRRRRVPIVLIRIIK